MGDSDDFITWDIPDLYGNKGKVRYPRASGKTSLSLSDYSSSLASWKSGAVYDPPYDDITISDDLWWSDSEDWFTNRKKKKFNYFIVYTTDKKELSEKYIFDTIETLKRKLMVDCANITVEKIICRMSVTVKETLLLANAKLKMFGKKPLIIPCFDEDLNPLSDEIVIDVKRPMTIEVLDEKKCKGEKYYLELEAIRLSGAFNTPSI